MFDISWSELLILGVVTLIFVGPKELPVFLRTIGRYVGMVKRQAGEFRAQFDEAMREAEMEALKREVETVRSDVSSSLREAERSLNAEFAQAEREVEAARPQRDEATGVQSGGQSADPHAHDADGLPLQQPAAPAPRPASAAPAAPAAPAQGAGAPVTGVTSLPVGEGVIGGAPGSAHVPVPPFRKGA